MARYDYICPRCEAVEEVQHSMTETVFVVHEGCFVPCEKYFSPDNIFRTQEDRRHMRGEGKSHATGQPYAQSRREERVIEKAGGFEFIGKSEIPEQWRTLAEHHRYVKAGGTALAPDVLNPPPDPRVEPGTILKHMAKRGLRFGCR
jgi:predicted nucleic acid-binding Zn ribbon protein